MSENMDRTKLVVNIGTWVLQAAMTGMVWWIATDIREDMDRLREDAQSVKADVSTSREAIVDLNARLRVAEPADVLEVVRTMPSRQDLQAMLRTDAPWALDKPEWTIWRARIEAELNRLKEEK